MEQEGILPVDSLGYFLAAQFERGQFGEGRLANLTGLSEHGDE